MKTAIIVKQGAGPSDPVNQTHTLGIKVEIDGKQYGIWFDQSGLRALGLEVVADGGTYYTELKPLVEGTPPPVEEVPWG